MDRDDDRDLSDAEEVLAVHFGRSANCSSVGSVVDLLFVSSLVGSMVITSMAVLLQEGTDGDGEHAEADDEEPPAEGDGSAP